MIKAQARTQKPQAFIVFPDVGGDHGSISQQSEIYSALELAATRAGLIRSPAGIYLNHRAETGKIRRLQARSSAG
ncbi:MAG TPA: hypothetical protein VGQ54_14080 [Burkholderiales bacterium]|nr:hypothetical protein [Burkholderiales bacterium]